MHEPPLLRIRLWQFWNLPARVRWLILLAELAALMLTARLAVDSHPALADVLRLSLLAALSIAFEEVSLRVEASRLRFRDSRQNDMAAVWTFAGAIVLPIGLAVVMVGLVRLHIWLRYERAPKVRPHFVVFTFATTVLACIAAHETAAALVSLLRGVGGGLDELITICAAIAAYAFVMAAFGQAVTSGAPLGAPSWTGPTQPRGCRMEAGHEQPLLKIGTLCLAGVAALAIDHKPWLAILVLPTMLVLNRSGLVRSLEVAATTDPKTGLLNLAAWRHLAAKELARSDRENGGAALLVIDMDNFKLINDSHGHLAGDVVLTAVAELLKHESRPYDVVGRFGGEEFVLLLSQVSPREALEISDRLLRAVRQLEVQPRESSLPPIASLSASIGLACYPNDGSTIEQLLRTADAALYVAKRDGRDRVEFSSVPAESHFQL